MNRRQHLKMLASAGALLAAPASAATAPPQLHVDLEVDPAKETEMVANYHKTFRPAIRKQPGFVDVKLLKLQSAIAGKPPANSTYRLLISFETEELRKKWVATDTHQKVWPTIESTLKGAKYSALLYEVI